VPSNQWGTHADEGLSQGCPVSVRLVTSARPWLRPGMSALYGVVLGYNASVVVSTGRDWHAIEKLYVFGEGVRVREDGSEERTFPTIRAIAQRFGISRSVVGEKAFRDDWVGRRFEFLAALRRANCQKQMDHEVARAGSPPLVHSKPSVVR